MGSRIQVAIDIKFKHQNFTHVEREIYHYQDSGYNNDIFMDVSRFLSSARAYLIHFTDDSRAHADIYGELMKRNINRMAEWNNPLKTNLIDIIKSPFNSKLSLELFDGDKTPTHNQFNDMSETDFYHEFLSHDRDNGALIIELSLDSGDISKCYCRWAFSTVDANFSDADINELKCSDDSAKSYAFKSFAKSLIDESDLEQTFSLNYNQSLEYDFKHIMDYISFLSQISVNDANGFRNLIEYDTNYFETKFNQLIK